MVATTCRFLPRFHPHGFWGVFNMGVSINVPLVVIHFHGIFPYKPSSYWGSSIMGWTVQHHSWGSSPCGPKTLQWQHRSLPTSGDAGELEIWKMNHPKSYGQKWTHQIGGSIKPGGGWYGFRKWTMHLFDWLISCKISLQPANHVQSEVPVWSGRSAFPTGIPPWEKFTVFADRVFSGRETKRYWLKLKQKICSRLFRHAYIFLFQHIFLPCA